MNGPTPTDLLITLENMRKAGVPETDPRFQAVGRALGQFSADFKPVDMGSELPRSDFGLRLNNAGNALGTALDAAGQAIAVPGRPDLNLEALARRGAGLIPGQPSVAEDAAQTAADERGNRLATVLGGLAGHVIEAEAGANAVRPLARLIPGVGAMPAIVRSGVQGAAGGAAGLPEHPLIGAGTGAVLNGAGTGIVRALDRGVIPLTEEEAALGLRNGAGHPIARVTAGTSGAAAMRASNADAATAVGKVVSGADRDAPLSYDTLEEARNAPGAVYDRVGQSLPQGPVSSNARAIIESAGQTGKRITKGTPQAQTEIASLQQQLLDPNAKFTGEQIVGELRGLRQDGYANIGSEDVSRQQLGRAQLDMARGLEQHINDTLPQDAPVTLDQLKDARIAIAQNYAVQGALRGNQVDMAALARIQKNDPGLLSGDLKTLAGFAAKNSDVASPLAGNSQLPSFASDLLNWTHTRPIISSIRVLGGGPVARSLLMDNGAADRIFAANPEDPGRFAPNEPGAPAAPDWSTSPGAGGAPSPRNFGGYPYADVLSTGVEQPAEPGLTASSPVAPAPSGVAPNFAPSEAARLSGGLSLAVEPGAGGTAGAAPYTDLARVQAQGVPEGPAARVLKKAPKSSKLGDQFTIGEQ